MKNISKDIKTAISNARSNAMKKLVNDERARNQIFEHTWDEFLEEIHLLSIYRDYIRKYLI